MASAMEVELAAMFINTKEAVPLRVLLTESEHPQGPTPMKVDNTTTLGMTTKTVTPRCSKAVDMCFHWLKCREAQRQFNFYWASGKESLTDYYSKHSPLAHHHKVWHQYVT
eukprot:CAMPEP_0171410040 /NCGR_PEP_ID=MMETSP0880-20121228/26337_1 /TAXON_ID=67004 /ORGANISM="Thalassiosira weissflogii, Strain CCMP1336" /LENGTH=110 /DNA_ID=CAMNT_0011926697 /DNA_START=999 /DNA_END=1327 /DNA_ORIENTATION=+